MIKRYLFSAYWRKKDIEFLKNLETNRELKEGFCGFNVDEKTYDTILKHYSKNNTIFNKVRPKDFKVRFTGVEFSNVELDSAKYYVLNATGVPKGYPQPEDGYKNNVFDFEECDTIRVNKIQVAPFRIKKPKWSKGQVNFSLNWEWDFMFFKKEFYHDVLAPLGLGFREVLNHDNGQPLEDTVQLNIPIAKSKILIENSAYDIYQPRCGKKQYSRQTLDFFPPFEEEFDFHICYTQEEFDGGFKRIIVSKEFSQILLRNNLINYSGHHIIPMKNK